MALSRIKIWSSGEVLTASDLNGEINNILTHPGTLVSPMPVAMLHADGTLAAPGISWSGEPNTGFARTSATVMNAVIAGANNMQWQPGHTFCFTAFDLPNAQAINFYNAAGNALWEVIHANAANTVHIGRIGWGATTIYGGGVGNLTVTAAGVALSGTITGISGATIGLPQVTNWRQVYELRNGANAIYIGWNGTHLDCQIDGSYRGGNWPITINGAAGSLWQNGTINGTAMVFNWSGQGGQPTWLWGSNDGTNHYVYNPSNFSVNYATSAGSAGSAGTANYANSAGAVNTPEGVTQNFHWSVQGGPSYVWGNWGTGDCYIYPTGNLSVNYANSAGSASSANTANYATSAGSASSAGSAGSVSTINGASGGTISGDVTDNGKLIVNRDSSGSSVDYNNSSVLIQGNAPTLALHWPGVTAWKMTPVSTDIVIGGNSGGGPSSTGGGAIQMRQDANCFARAFNSTGLRSATARQLTGALTAVLKLRGQYGIDDDTGELDLGIEVEELEGVFPAVVRSTKNMDGTLRGKGINYAALAAPIIEAIRELNDRLTALENA